MKLHLLLVLLLAVTGCSTVDQTIKPDTVFTDTVKQLPLASDTIQVQPVPDSPTAIKATDAKGNAVVGFTKEGLDQLRQMRAAAETDAALAQQALSTLNSVINERNAVAKIGEVEQARANFYAEQYQVKAKEADREHRYRVVEEWASRISLLALLAILH